MEPVGDPRAFLAAQARGNGALRPVLFPLLTRADLLLNRLYTAPPPPSPLPLKSVVDPTLALGKRPLSSQPEHAETAAGLSQLSQSQAIPSTPLAIASASRLQQSDEVSLPELEQHDKRFKTIRKSFTAEEEKAYSSMVDHFLRNEEKVLTINELAAHLEGKIPARFSDTEKKNFIRSTYYNLAVQFSRMHKLQLRLLLQDTETQRWLEDPLVQYPDEVRRREHERRIAELSRDLATRTMSGSSPFIRPSEHEISRARQLIIKWLNPQLRPVLLSKHEQPKKRRKQDPKTKEAGSPGAEPVRITPE